MPIAIARAFIEELTDDEYARDGAVRTQVAVIRSLMAEIQHGPAVDSRRSVLRDQVAEEMMKLGQMRRERGSRRRGHDG